MMTPDDGLRCIVSAARRHAPDSELFVLAISTAVRTGALSADDIAEMAGVPVEQTLDWYSGKNLPLSKMAFQILGAMQDRINA